MLETERLVLRPMVAGDLDGLLEIFADPLVMASFGETPFDRDQMQGWLGRNLAHQLRHGFGLFAVCLKGDGRLIGDCGLELMDVDGEHVAELGFDFRSDCWNQGYATEAACAVRDYAFTILELPRLVSLVRLGNRASARVAEKTGLKQVARVQRHGSPYLRYELRRY